MTARRERYWLAVEWLAFEARREEWYVVPPVNRVMFAGSLRERWWKGEWQVA